MRSTPRRDPTSERIIAAAGAVFGEKGFRATTIRQITARADVNLAAVNYHFKNKNELYVQVLREAKKHVALLVISDFKGSPEEQLRGFIKRFVQYLLDPKRPAWHGRVLSMEMSNPTPALGVIIRELTAPLYRDMRDLIHRIVDGAANPSELDLLANSIMSQCVFYASCRPMAEQLSLQLNRTPNRVERIADHVASFSVAALRNFRPRPASQSARTRNSSSQHLLLS